MMHERSLVIALLSALLTTSAAGVPLTTGFSYQGRATSNGIPINGLTTCSSPWPEPNDACAQIGSTIEFLRDRGRQCDRGPVHGRAGFRRHAFQRGQCVAADCGASPVRAAAHLLLCHRDRGCRPRLTRYRRVASTVIAA